MVQTGMLGSEHRAFVVHHHRHLEFGFFGRNHQHFDPMFISVAQVAANPEELPRGIQLGRAGFRERIHERLRRTIQDGDFRSVQFQSCAVDS